MEKRDISTPETGVNRSRAIVTASVIGIIANIFLAAFKAVIGTTSNSVAVISDAVNNLSDALSSVITIIGTKLAGKAPDKKHPMGYGRIEYLSALIVSAIVLYAGITTLVDSIKKIIHPEEVNYSAVSLIIIGVAIIVKLGLGLFTKNRGKKVNSGSLVASGQDAFQDAVLSASVLISALIFVVFKINLEAYVGSVIALFIIKSGIEMILESVNEMLGVRIEGEVTKAIKKTITEFPQVHGAYDLFMNNYGPDRNIASVHIEVDDTITAKEIDTLSRSIQAAVYQQHGVIIDTVGIYSTNTGDEESARIREDIYNRVRAHQGVIQLHGFYIDIPAHTITFDIIIDFSVKDRRKACEEIKSEIAALYPDYYIRITLDNDLSE